MEPNYIFCNEILYYISRKNAILIKIANVAQTIIMVKIFKRNVRPKKYFNNPKQYSTFGSFCKMTLDSLRDYHEPKPTVLWRVLVRRCFHRDWGWWERPSTLSQDAPHAL